MGQLKVGILFMTLAVGLVATSRCQIEPAINKLVFNNPIQKVADSIDRMEHFLKMFPQTNMVNYFVDNNGYLYLNNEKIAPIVGAIHNPKVRKDMVFENFKSEEVDEFFFVMAFLWKNGIQSSHLEPTIGTFTFQLATGEERKESSRFIIIADEPSDTSSVYFNKLYRVIDRREKLVLMGNK